MARKAGHTRPTPTAGRAESFRSFASRSALEREVALGARSSRSSLFLTALSLPGAGNRSRNPLLNFDVQDARRVCPIHAYLEIRSMYFGATSWTES